MKDGDLEKFIRDMSNRTFDKPVSLYSISDKVDLALAWFRTPRGIQPDKCHSRIYLIKEECKYIGGVYLMKNNIHWLVLEEYRKKGYLYQSIHEDIFPHIFSDGRDYQKATAETEDGKQYLIRQGFEQDKQNDEVFYLSSNKVKAFDLSKIQRKGLSSSETECIEEKLRTISSELMFICDRLFCAYGNDRNLSECARRIFEMAPEIKYTKPEEA